MALFIPTIPQANDNLDFSQGQLLSNNAGLDTVFGIDHYTFSNATSSKGFHNQVTTPSRTGGHPVTVANPIFYAMQDSANLGVIQYSKGPNNPVATPVTMIQSPATPTIIGAASTSPVFDFTGLNRALCILVATDTVLTAKQAISYVVWTGSVVVVSQIFISPSVTQFGVSAAGSVVQLFNTSGVPYNDIYWTLQFLRVQ